MAHQTGQAPSAPKPAQPIVLHAYTFEHQSASEALAMVDPLLSAKGTVELQPGGNTLVIRDHASQVQKILEVLRRFDRPPRNIKLEIHLLEASRQTTSSPPSSELPASLVRRLGELTRYSSYRLQGQARLRTQEGQEVRYELGKGYLVNFTVGTMAPDAKLKLLGFKLTARKAKPPNRPLLHSHLTLLRDQTVTVLLARRESSETSLVVAVTWSETD